MVINSDVGILIRFRYHCEFLININIDSKLSDVSLRHIFLNLLVFSCIYGKVCDSFINYNYISKYYT